MITLTSQSDLGGKMKLIILVRCSRFGLKVRVVFQNLAGEGHCLPGKCNQVNCDNYSSSLLGNWE
jgi:hypothetical protein